MIVRYSVRSNLRAKGRSALFFLLILLLTAAMILALGVRIYCEKMLAQCDEKYRSIALIEVMGDDYPDEDVADSNVRENAQLVEKAGFSEWEGVNEYRPYSEGLGFAEGYRRWNSKGPFAKNGVIVAASFSKPREVEEAVKTRVWTATIDQLIYGDKAKEAILINIVCADPDFEPEYGKSYLLHGTFLGKNSLPFLLNGIETFEVLPFAGSDETPYVETKPGEDLPEVFSEAVAWYLRCNHYIYLSYIRDLANVYDFHQGLVTVKEGAAPDPSEENACVITADLADQLGLAVGDVLTVSEMDSDPDNRYAAADSGRIRNLTVRGITAESTDYSGQIWLVGEKPAGEIFGYELASVGLNNRDAQRLAEEMQEKLPSGIRVSLYDQGYAEVARPFMNLERTANNILLLCGGGTAAVLLLFGYLYVSRQSAAVKVMISLGTPKGKIVLWLLSGTFVIAGLAAAAGGLLGRIGLPALFARLEETFAGTERNSTLYSETMLGVRLENELAMSADYRAVPVCVILVMAAALLLCLAFVPSAFAQGSLKRGRSRVRVPQGRTGSIGRGSLRFALLSIRRGGWRTLVVPAVCMALTFLVLVLGSVYAGWQNQLADALDHTRIDGMAVSSNGKYYSGLVVPTDHVRELCRLDDVESIAVSNGYPYWLRSEEPAFAQTSFGQESRMDWIRRQPQIVSLNDLSGARDCYYSEAVVEYLDGWDESFLAEPDYPTLYEDGASMAEHPGEAAVYPAIVSSRFLEERGLAPGDTFAASFLVTKFYQEAELDTTLRIVGVYRQTGSKAQIYVPLAFSTPVDVLSGEEPEDLPVMDRYGWMNYSREEMLRYYYYRQQTFETCRFTLASARKLSESRQHLEETGFSSVVRLSKIRTTLVLRDASFLKLTETLERYIATGRIILVLISLLVLLVGFIVSWLMIHSRRMEFALMRGLGTPGMRIFASFFTEQLLLCLLGCLLGAGASLGLGGIRADAFWAAGGFFACYLGGCAAAILLTGQMKLMELFTYRD